MNDTLKSKLKIFIKEQEIEINPISKFVSVNEIIGLKNNGWRYSPYRETWTTNIAGSWIDSFGKRNRLLRDNLNNTHETVITVLCYECRVALYVIKESLARVSLSGLIKLTLRILNKESYFINQVGTCICPSCAREHL
jgi:hypothetical protein